MIKLSELFKSVEKDKDVAPNKQVNYCVHCRYSRFTYWIEANPTDNNAYIHFSNSQKPREEMVAHAHIYCHREPGPEMLVTQYEIREDIKNGETNSSTMDNYLRQTLYGEIKDMALLLPACNQSEVDPRKIRGDIITYRGNA